MPSVLREHQHELLDMDAGTGDTGYVFGTIDTGWLTTAPPTITPGDLRTTDVERPQEDGLMPGRDYQGAKSYGFEMTAITDAMNRLGGLDPHRANLDLLADLEGLWTARQWRSSPQAFAMLRSCAGGVTSRCYGRPRRWEEAANGSMTQQGYTPVVADFQLVDNRWFADDEEITEVGGLTGSGGGFIAPIVAPIVTTSSTEVDSTAVVGGKIPTWAVVEFHGPVTNPRLTVGDLFTVGLNGTIALGATVTIDPRPWVRTVLKVPGKVGVAGWITTATPTMRDLLLDPGEHLLSYSGVDASGLSYARLRWRPARPRP